VHKHCACPSPLLCKCPGDGEVVYVLGDLDLLCLEKECTPHCNPTHEEWEKMARHDPAGTMGMKPPEVQYVKDTYFGIIKCIVLMFAALE